MFKIKLKTALLVLHFCISISFVSSNDNKEVINDDLTELIETWVNNLSEYQRFDEKNTIGITEDDYYKEYLGKIFYDNANTLLLTNNNGTNNNPKGNNKNNKSKKTKHNKKNINELSNIEENNSGIQDIQNNKKNISDINNIEEDNNKKHVAKKKYYHGTHLNTGYAIVTFNNNTAKCVIDINKNTIQINGFDKLLNNNNVKNIIYKKKFFTKFNNNYNEESQIIINDDNKQYFDTIQDNIYKETCQISEEIRLDCYNVLEQMNKLKIHDEYKILDELFTFLREKKLKGKVKNINIKLFTYHDMCPSCWMVWNKCFEDFKNILKINDNNVQINVFSMKPYNFTEHIFLSFLKDKYQYRIQQENSLHSITNIDNFDNTNIGIRRSNVKKSNNINFFDNENSSTEDTNFTNHITQTIDKTGIKLLQKYYELLHKNNAILKQKIIYVYNLDNLWKEYSEFVKDFVIPLIANITNTNTDKNTIDNIRKLIMSDKYISKYHDEIGTLLNDITKHVYKSNILNEILPVIRKTYNFDKIITDALDSKVNKITAFFGQNINDIKIQNKDNKTTLSDILKYAKELINNINNVNNVQENIDKLKSTLKDIENVFDTIKRGQYIKIAEYVINEAEKDGNNNINNNNIINNDENNNMYNNNVDITGNMYIDNNIEENNNIIEENEENEENDIMNNNDTKELLKKNERENDMI